MPPPLAPKLEYWLVAPEIARTEIDAGCALAARAQCAAVYVKPHYLEHARKLLKETRVKLGAVIAFPSGGASTAAKMFEAQDVVQRGAQEIALMLNIGALRDGDDLAVKNDIAAVVKTARGHPVKVILEIYYLSDDEKMRACHLAQSAGAAFVQSSSGFAPGSGTLTDVRKIIGALEGAAVQVVGQTDDVFIAQKMIDAGAARVATTRLGLLTAT